MKGYISEDEAARMLKEYMQENFSNNTEAAYLTGMSYSHISKMINGKQRLSKKAEQMLGLTKVVLYKKV